MNQFTILTIFVEAFVSASGVFFASFLVLVAHFHFRKTYYKGRKERNLILIKSVNELIKLNDLYIQTMYREGGVKNYSNFVKKTHSSSSVAKVDSELSQKIKNIETVTQLALENNYIENYNFKTYLATILDRKYPDKYLK